MRETARSPVLRVHHIISTEPERISNAPFVVALRDRNPPSASHSAREGFSEHLETSKIG